MDAVLADLSKKIPNSKELVLWPPDTTFARRHVQTYSAQWLFHLLSARPRQLAEQLELFSAQRAQQWREAATASAGHTTAATARQHSTCNSLATAWRQLSSLIEVARALNKNYELLAQTQAAATHGAVSRHPVQPALRVEGWLRRAGGEAGGLAAARAYVNWFCGMGSGTPLWVSMLAVVSPVVMIPGLNLAPETLAALLDAAAGDMTRAANHPSPDINSLSSSEAATDMLQQAGLRRCRAPGDVLFPDDQLRIIDGDSSGRAITIAPGAYCAPAPYLENAAGIRAVVILQSGQPVRVGLLDTTELRAPYDPLPVLYVFQHLPLGDLRAALRSKAGAVAAAMGAGARLRLALVYLLEREKRAAGGPALDQFLYGDAESALRTDIAQLLAAVMDKRIDDRPGAAFVRHARAACTRFTDMFSSAEQPRPSAKRRRISEATLDYRVAIQQRRPAEEAATMDTAVAVAHSLLQSVQVRAHDDFSRCIPAIESLATLTMLQRCGDVMPAGGYVRSEPYADM